MSKRSNDDPIEPNYPIDPIDISKRSKNEAAYLVDDDLHSSFLSMNLEEDLSPLTPLPMDMEDTIDSLNLGMYHWNIITTLISQMSRFWILDTTCWQWIPIEWRVNQRFEGTRVSYRWDHSYYSAVGLPPSHAAKEPPSPSLSKGIKNLINDICEEIVKHWPPFPDGFTSESKNVLIFVTPYTFYEILFKEKLQLKVNEVVVKRSQVSKKW